MGSFIELFFLEHDFHTDSGTEMSSLYSVKERTRYDWGWVENELRRGIDKITIRPATDEETLWAFKKLSKLKEKRAEKACASCKTL